MNLDLGEKRLSEQQKQVLRLQASNFSLVCQCLLNINGEVDTYKLSDAIQRVFESHEIFKQGLQEQLTPYFYTDISTEADQQDRLNDLANQAIHEVEKNTCITVSLICLSADNHVMLLSVPTLVADSYSMKLIASEICQRYLDQPLKEESINYDQFIEWQNSLLEVPEEEAGSFWKRYGFSGYHSMKLSLEKSKETTVIDTKNTNIRIAQPQLTAIKKMVNKKQTTISNFLLTLWKVLLQRHTGESLLDIGFINNVRRYEELENTIGPMAIILPIITELESHDTISDILSQVQGVVEEVTAWEEYFYVSDYAKQLSGENHSVIPITFEYITLNHAVWKSENINFRIQQIRSNTSESSLKILSQEFEDHLEISISYAEEHWEGTSITSLLQQYTTLIVSVLENPDEKLDRINMLSEKERKLIEAFNQPINEWKTYGSIVEAFEAQVQRTPEAIALQYGEERISYNSLNAQANRLAHHLREHYQVQPSDVLGLMMSRSNTMIVGIMGILKAGAAYLPIDPNYPIDRKEFMLKDAAVDVLLTDSSHMFDFGTSYEGGIIALDIQLPILEESEANPRSVNVAEDLCYVIYTSGSTGKPKGVNVTHDNLLNYTHWFIDSYDINEADSTLLLSSIAFDLSYTSLWGSLLSGGSLYVLSDEEYRDPIALLRVLQSGEISYVKLTPTHFKMLIDNVAFDDMQHHLSSLRLVVLGGETIRVSEISKYLINHPDTVFVNHYGPTETTIGTISHTISPQNLEVFKQRPIIGKAITNNKAFILDENGEICATGVIGEISISGKGVTQGYRNQEVLTLGKFVEGLVLGEGKIYRTGDLGRWLSDGNIEFIGRKDHQIKIRGYRIELGEVEIALNTIEGIAESIAIGKIVEDDVPQLVAYYIGSEEIEFTVLRSHLVTMLPDYMIPSHFMHLVEFPMLGNGKIDRKLLPNPQEKSRRCSADYVAPETPLERQLVNIWEETLGVDKIGIRDDFFELGGHSLKAIQVVSKVYKELSVEIELREIFDTPTITELASIISNAEKHSYEEIVPVAIQDNYALSHAQKRLWVLDQIEENSTAYNRLAGYTFQGEFDKNAFEKAFDTLVERHESLRTTFTTVKGEPRQIIHAEWSDFSKVEFTDLRTDDNRSAHIAEITDKEVKTPFNLEKGPLLRLRLFQLEDQHYIFLFNLHHIVSDGWTMKVLVNEILVLYNTYKNAVENPLTPLRVQYKDYAAWQNKKLNEQSITSHKEFWLKQFGGDVPVLNLTSDFPRPVLKTYNGSITEIFINKKVKDGLLDLGQKNGASLFMTLVACLNTLLYRYTGQEDIVIGSPIAGRDHPDLENQIGFFVNTLALRNKFDGKDNFETLLNTVKENTLNVYQHQVYPYDRIVDELNLDRDRSRTPLFDVNLVLQNNDAIQTEEVDIPMGFEGVSINSYDTDFVVSRYDLLFHCYERKDGLFINLEYNTDLFLPDRAKAILSHFETLVTSIVDDSKVALNALTYLTKTDNQRIFEAFSSTSVPEYLGKTLHKLFIDQAAKTPEAVALHCGDEVLNYGQLEARSNQLSNFLKAIYVHERPTVALMMDNSIDLVVSMLGVLKSGGLFVPVDPSNPIDRSKYILNDSACECLIGQKKFIKNMNNLQWQCSNLRHLLCIDSESFFGEGEDLSELMKEELWDYIGENSIDDISMGGWKSSYTGENLSREEMDEYSLNAYDKVIPLVNIESKVLEIGCSSGITMFRIAPLVGEYIGTDLSSKILDMTQREVVKRGIDNIKLQHLPANKIDSIKDKFDVIIINSVVQNFNGLNYLRDVIKKGLNLLKEKGVIFIGGVQDLELKADLIESLVEFREQNKDKNYIIKTDWSNELFVHKKFFTDLKSELSEIEEVHYSSETGGIKNELTEYRYDVIIQVNKNIVDSNQQQISKYKEQYDKTSLMAFDDLYEEEEVSPQQPAYIIYTSGSTGKPKGVKVSHESISNYVQWSIDTYFETGVGNMALFTAPSFDLTLTSIFCPISSGRKLFIYADEAVNERLYNVFTNIEIDTVKLTPTHISLLNYLPIDFTGVQRVIVGGEELKKRHIDVLKSFDVDMRIYNEYGPTENTVGCTMGKVTKDYYGVGKPIANTRVLVLDEHNYVLPPGNIGEICTSGTCLAMEYINDPQQTSAKFITHPYVDQQRIYKTGDLGKWLPDGKLEIVGRKDNQVKIRGYRIEISEIEKRIQDYMGVEETVVVVNKYEDKDSELIAYYTGRTVEISTIKNELSSHLSEYMIPEIFIHLESLPYSAHGKVDVQLLPNPDEIHLKGDHGYIPPQNETEETLVKIWEEILERRMISTDNNFFDLGGHSLKATQLITRIYKELNTEVTLGEVFNKPTITELATLISNIDDSTYQSIPQVEEQETYELSHAQRRLWVIDQLDEQTAAYNMTGTNKFKGKLDVEAFTKSFETLVARHEILRTTFVKIEGSPRQKVHQAETFPFKIEYIDWRQFPEKVEKIKASVDDEVNRGFDLEKGPLLRINLIQQQDDEFVFVLNMHHIISDGWSMDILIKEIFELYAAYSNHQENPLAPLTIQYKDYASWQNNLLDKENKQGQSKFWLDLFEGNLPVLNLPTDYPRPELKTYNGTTHSFVLEQELVRSMDKLGSEHQMSRFMILIAVVNVLLHRQSGQEDIVLGVPMAGRDHKELENQIGLYANTLALRTRFSAAQDFETLLNEVKKVTLGAYSNAAYPFDKLVSDLNVKRDMSRSPLFDVMVVLQNSAVAKGEVMEIKDIVIDEYESNFSQTKFDLSFYFIEQNNEIIVRVKYNTDLFKAQRIEMLAQEFESLLNSIIDQPHQPISEFVVSNSFEDKFYSNSNDDELNFEFNF